MADTEDRVREALEAHARGWTLTPLWGKKPYLDNWTTLPRPSDLDVREWARAGNIGLRTGLISGVDVVDEDTAKGGHFKDAPHTITVLTGGGGKHFYFAHVGTDPIKNSVGRIAPHVDLRGDGGQVVFVGSVHPQTGEVYRWAEGKSPSEAPLLPLPQSLLVSLHDRRTITRPTAEYKGNGKANGYGGRALEAECATVAAAAPGTRNDTLNRSSFNLGQLVPHVLDGATVRARLFGAAENCGLVTDDGMKQAMETIESGITAGMAKPRTIPERKPQPLRSVPKEPERFSEEEEEEEPQEDIEVPVHDSRIPRLPDSCWRYGFDSFRQAYGGCTEATDAFLWGAYAVAAGLCVGRKAQLKSSVNVFPLLWVCLVGNSGKSRKSTAQSFGVRALQSVDEGVLIVPGVGSPEGLLESIAPKDIHLVTETRALLDLPELSSLLLKAAAEATRGLGPMLTNLYDCPPSYALPKAGHQRRVNEPFVAILSGTTMEWLQRDLTDDNLRGGLANRFLFLVGAEKDPIPFPPAPDGDALQLAQQVLLDARDRHSVHHTYLLDPGAHAVFEDWYLEHWKTGADGVLDVMAQRLHTNAWRVALLFAALEASPLVTRDHMAAAVEFAEYQRACHRVVFEGYGETSRSKTERRILDALQKHGGQPSWRLRQMVRHVSAEDFQRALKALQQVEDIVAVQQGRAKLWRLRGTVSGPPRGTSTPKHLKPVK